MVDYAKLAAEERARQDSADSVAEAQGKLETELLDFFKSVETHLDEEMGKANQELEKRGDPVFSGPSRPFRGENRIDLAYGTRSPCSKLTLQTNVAEVGLSRILVELLDDAGDVIAQTEYVLETEESALKAYKPLVEGFPDRAAEVTSAEIAQEIVSGMIRGRFE
jgi:hypothetical protein